VAVAALTVLIALGIISSSAAVGIAKKSPSAGFLTLALQVGAALGLLAGSAVGLIATLVSDSSGPIAIAVGGGAAGGVVAGTAIGWLVHFSACAACRWLRDNVEIGGLGAGNPTRS